VPERDYTYIITAIILVTLLYHLWHGPYHAGNCKGPGVVAHTDVGKNWRRYETVYCSCSLQLSCQVQRRTTFVVHHFAITFKGNEEKEQLMLVGCQNKSAEDNKSV
jgi:hypothetical protein